MHILGTIVEFERERNRAQAVAHADRTRADLEGDGWRQDVPTDNL
jgi:hypothetical protein